MFQLTNSVKTVSVREKYVAILFIIIILGCKREREKPLEPVGAAVFVWKCCTDYELEPVLHNIGPWCAGEAAPRAVWGMGRLLQRWNLQCDFASPDQYHRYDPLQRRVTWIISEWPILSGFDFCYWSENRCLLWTGWPSVPFGGPSVGWPGSDLRAGPEANVQQSAAALHCEPGHKFARRSSDAA